MWWILPKVNEPKKPYNGKMLTWKRYMIRRWADQPVGTGRFVANGYLAGRRIVRHAAWVYFPGRARSLLEMEEKIGIGLFEQTIGYRLKYGEGLSGKVWETLTHDCG